MKWQASAQIGVRTTGGFAAAQCGKASPFRVLVSNLSREAKPRLINWKIPTESQRLSALCGGKAATSR